MIWSDERWNFGFGSGVRSRPRARYGPDSLESSDASGRQRRSEPDRSGGSSHPARNWAHEMNPAHDSESQTTSREGEGRCPDCLWGIFQIRGYKMHQETHLHTNLHQVLHFTVTRGKSLRAPVRQFY